MFQVFILMITGLFALPEVKLRQQIATEAHVELYCNTSLDGFLPPLVYNLSIIILCGCHGFLTRKLPENFNEAWYIFVSVATTSFLQASKWTKCVGAEKHVCVSDRLRDLDLFSSQFTWDFEPYPPIWNFFLNWFTLISRMTKIDLPGAEFSPWAENLEACSMASVSP